MLQRLRRCLKTPDYRIGVKCPSSNPDSSGRFKCCEPLQQPSHWELWPSNLAGLHELRCAVFSLSLPFAWRWCWVLPPVSPLTPITVLRCSPPTALLATKFTSKPCLLPFSFKPVLTNWLVFFLAESLPGQVRLHNSRQAARSVCRQYNTAAPNLGRSPLQRGRQTLCMLGVMLWEVGPLMPGPAALPSSCCPEGFRTS